MSPRIKYFCLKKKSNISLNKNVIFVFHTILKLDFITQINCFIHRCLYSLFILSLFLYQFHANGTMKVLTLPYSYNWQKFNNKINEKRSHAYQSMYPECVTGQINSRIVDLLLRQSCRLIHAPSWKSWYAFSLIKHFPNNHKRYSSHLQVSILHRVAHIKVYLRIYESLKNSYLKKVLVS